MQEGREIEVVSGQVLSDSVIMEHFWLILKEEKTEWLLDPTALQLNDSQKRHEYPPLHILKLRKN